MKLGVIGYGYRMHHMVNEFKKVDPSVEVVAIVERNIAEYSKREEFEGTDVKFFEDADAMLDECQLDAVAIGTRCSLHTSYAVKVLAKGLPLFLEKPVSTTYEDLAKLYQASKTTHSEVVVSFPLRRAAIVDLAKEIIDSGRIGEVQHVQAVNNVPYGGIYYQNWYRDEEETQGLFLQKATHDFDYINYLVGKQPVEICAMNSKQIFKGDMPAGLQCGDCEKKETCFESSILKRRRGDDVPGEYCCFAVDTGNEDSGSALIRYENGMHAVYSQNFFARREAQARGARLLGYKGTLEFDFYTGKLTVYRHDIACTETYQLEHTENHHGGDAALAQNFVDIVNHGEKSKFTLEAGMLSALLCLKAKQSAQTSTFQNICLTEDMIHG